LTKKTGGEGEEVLLQAKKDRICNRIGKKTDFAREEEKRGVAGTSPRQTKRRDFPKREKGISKKGQRIASLKRGKGRAWPFSPTKKGQASSAVRQEKAESPL